MKDGQPGSKEDKFSLSLLSSMTRMVYIPQEAS